MANAWGVPHDAASLRAQMHSRVDYLFDLLENQPGEAQESQQESSPLLLEARPEVRHRIQRPSVSASLEVQNPEESIWARAWRRFLGFLQSLRQWCRDVLTWLREKAAAILEAICSAVEAVWGLLSGFSFSAGQLFGNLIQV
ncbi:interleukin-32-like isoform 2-T2 [Dama dama]|uniref:interleukin-32 isoform X2 n=1 Tax=Dama dama TaxID=30532 RepID=UPI002A3642A2|nr:interleukin-32 isoform X2 [Dama dama]